MGFDTIEINLVIILIIQFCIILNDGVMLYSFYFEYISIINDMILNFMMLATVKHFFGGGGRGTELKLEERPPEYCPPSIPFLLNGQLCLEKWVGNPLKNCPPPLNGQPSEVDGGENFNFVIYYLCNIWMYPLDR